MIDNDPQITEVQLRSAEAAEQSALDEVQKAHFRKRVVLLRVQLDQAREELAVAQETIRTLQQQGGSDTTPKESEDPSTD